MNRPTRHPGRALMLAAGLTALTLTGCTTTAQAPVTAQSAATETAEPTTEPTTEPVVEPTVEPTPEVVFPTEAGATIPADQVEAARAAGVPIFVSPATGVAIVVALGQPIPEIIAAEILAADTGAPGADITADRVRSDARVVVMTALEESGVPFAVIYTIGTYGGFDSEGFSRVQYVYAVRGIPDARAIMMSQEAAENVAGALANLQPTLDANPGMQVIYLT